MPLVERGHQPAYLVTIPDITALERWQCHRPKIDLSENSADLHVVTPSSTQYALPCAIQRATWTSVSTSSCCHRLHGYLPLRYLLLRSGVVQVIEILAGVGVLPRLVAPRDRDLGAGSQP